MPPEPPDGRDGSPAADPLGALLRLPPEFVRLSVFHRNRTLADFETKSDELYDLIRELYDTWQRLLWAEHLAGLPSDDATARYGKLAASFENEFQQSLSQFVTAVRARHGTALAELRRAEDRLPEPGPDCKGYQRQDAAALALALPREAILPWPTPFPEIQKT
jgi:hypothetical protein